MNRGLIIKQPWIELILSGKKTWEMRSRPTHIRGKIGLIEQGTGLIVGEVEIIDCLRHRGISRTQAFYNHLVERVNHTILRMENSVSELVLLLKGKENAF